MGGCSSIAGIVSGISSSSGESSVVGAGTLMLGATTVAAGKGGDRETKDTFTKFSVDLLQKSKIAGTSKQILVPKQDDNRRVELTRTVKAKSKRDVSSGNTDPKYRRESLESVNSVIVLK